MYKVYSSSSKFPNCVRNNPWSILFDKWTNAEQQQLITVSLHYLPLNRDQACTKYLLTCSNEDIVNDLTDALLEAALPISSCAAAVCNFNVAEEPELYKFFQTHCKAAAVWIMCFFF